MVDLKSFKKIAVVGMGTNNKKLADYLSKINIPFETVEWKTESDLNLKKYDLIFRTPGLPFLSKPIQEAKAFGVTVYSQTKLFFDLCEATIIGVTGTKGKGTTASLIHHVLSAAKIKSWLAGNIGLDPFEFLDKINSNDIVVYELSSFQLQDLHKSPHIAVVLQIAPDHLNHHKNFDEYIDAKSKILSFQNEKDFAILSKDLPESFSARGGSESIMARAKPEAKLMSSGGKNTGKGKKIYYNPSTVANFKTNLLGAHNRENIAASFEAVKLVGVTEAIFKKSLESFQPLPHRLQDLGEINDIKVIDDAFSTNILSTVAALDAADTFMRPIILIVGGSNKNLDFTPVGEKILQLPNVKTVIIIGNVTEKITAVLKNFKGKILTGAVNMHEIMTQAKDSASSGDVLLFSPGAASFGLFKNEFERARQFVNAIKELQPNVA